MWKATQLVWLLTVVSMLIVSVALRIAVRGAVTSGDYKALLSHQILTLFVTIAY